MSVVNGSSGLIHWTTYIVIHNMIEPLAADIERKLARDCPAESIPAVLRAFATYQGPERNRVIRCIVHLMAGDAQRTSHYVGVATQDYRDVIYWAEYDADERKVRDFNEPFAQT
jgi:hypothetical protein